MLIIALAVMAAHCGSEKRPTFTVPDDYRSWRKPVNKVLDYPVPGHGATYRIIYGNEISFTARVAKDKDGYDRLLMPDGSVIIKEVFKNEGDVNSKKGELTIMVKNSRDTHAVDGWLYFVRMPGKSAMLVTSRMCVGCHEAANERHPYFDKNPKGTFRDYLFVNFSQ